MLAKLMEDLLEMFGAACDGIITLLLQSVEPSLETLESYIPALSLTQSVLRDIGLGIVSYIILFEAIRLITSGITGQLNGSVGSTIFRLIMAGAFTIYGYSIAKIFIDYIVNNIYTSMLEGMTESAYSSYFADLTDSFSVSMDDILADVVGYTNIRTLFCGILSLFLMWQMIKVCWNMLYRYIALGICAYLAPICISFSGSSSTDNITKTWMRTMMSQAVLMIFTAWGCRIVTVSMATTATGNSLVLKYMFLVLFAKFITKSDSFLQRLGFNTLPGKADVASARGGLGGLVRSTMMTVSSATRTLGDIGRRTSNPAATAAAGPGPSGFFGSYGIGKTPGQKEAAKNIAFASGTRKDANGNLSVPNKMAKKDNEGRMEAMSGTAAAIRGKGNLTEAQAVSMANKSGAIDGRAVGAVKNQDLFMKDKDGNWVSFADAGKEGAGYFTSRYNDKTGKYEDGFQILTTDGRSGIGDGEYAYKAKDGSLVSLGRMGTSEIGAYGRDYMKTGGTISSSADGTAIASSLKGTGGGMVATSLSESSPLYADAKAAADVHNSFISGGMDGMSKGEQLEKLNSAGINSDLNNAKAVDTVTPDRLMLKGQDGSMASAQNLGINAGLEKVEYTGSDGSTRSQWRAVGDIDALSASGMQIAGGSMGNKTSSGGMQYQEFRPDKGFEATDHAAMAAASSLKETGGGMVATNLPESSPLYADAKAAADVHNGFISGGMNSMPKGEQLERLNSDTVTNSDRSGAVVTDCLGPDKVRVTRNGETNTAQNLGLNVGLQQVQYADSHGNLKSEWQAVGDVGSIGGKIEGGELGSISHNGGVARQEFKTDRGFSSDAQGTLAYGATVAVNDEGRMRAEYDRNQANYGGGLDRGTTLAAVNMATHGTGNRGSEAYTKAFNDLGTGMAVNGTATYTCPADKIVIRGYGQEEFSTAKDLGRYAAMIDMDVKNKNGNGITKETYFFTTNKNGLGQYDNNGQWQKDEVLGYKLSDTVIPSQGGYLQKAMKIDRSQAASGRSGQKKPGNQRR